MIGARFGQAGCHHVSVAGCLDTLEPVILGHDVEFTDQIVQHRHKYSGNELTGKGREVDNVREQDAGFLVLIRDDLPALQAFGDRCRRMFRSRVSACLRRVSCVPRCSSMTRRWRKSRR